MNNQPTGLVPIISVSASNTGEFQAQEISLRRYFGEFGQPYLLLIPIAINQAPAQKKRKRILSIMIGTTCACQALIEPLADAARYIAAADAG